MPPNLKKEQQIKFYLQDVEIAVDADSVSPSTSLNSYIRNTLQLTGTKYMCYEGGCGSCLVALYTRDEATDKDIYLAVNSCLVPVLSCNGWRLYTIEGIGDPVNGYHPVQEALAAFNGTQCGYCSSGMVMNMFALYESGKLTMAEVENSFGGNICRCTGYRPILSAFKSLCTDADPKLLGEFPDIEDLRICKKDGKCEKKCIKKLDKTPIYHLLADASRWVKVYTLSDLLNTLQESPDSTYRLVSGNTAKAIFSAYGSTVDLYIDVSSVAELKVQQIVGNTFVLGANTTLTDAMDAFNATSENIQFSYLKKLAAHIDLVAHVPVRNVGSIAGNLTMKHDHQDFASDVFIILETVGALLTIVGIDGQTVQMSPLNFLSYDMSLKVITTITFPSYSADNVKYVSYKIMPRAQAVHAHVNAGFLFTFNASNLLENAVLVYGNINPTFNHATNTESFLRGKDLFNNTVLQQAYQSLSNELICATIPPDPAPEFRQQLAIALFYKAVLSIAPAERVSPQNVSGRTVLERPVSSGAQDYQTNESLYPATQAIPKIEALAQTSGRAQYIRDMPDAAQQHFGYLVLAQAPPNSTIRNIDASQALEVEGIVAFYSNSDIPGSNTFAGGEEIFCTGRVQYYEQPVGILVGTSEGVLRSSDGLVKITYDPPNEAPLLSTRQVLAAGRYDRIQGLQTINASRRGNDIRHVVSGSFDIYHQYHLHMETQCCNVVPNENGLDIYPSSQSMDYTQAVVANMLQIPTSKVNISVRRLGGAFGAKISRNNLITCAAALAAWKLRKPVKLSLSLSQNMAAIGKRWPLSTDYEVGLNDQGIIQYLDCTHYSDLGAVRNELGVAELISLFTSNYVNDTFTIQANGTITDTATNTYERAPGSTEGLGSIEAIMEHCAVSLNMDPLDFRIANLPDLSPLFEYINDMRGWADIDQRKQEISEFNRTNRWKKKGLSVVPMIYGFGGFGPFSAVVTIFHNDGSVQITHGGVEMGQGINTKAAQVCAYRLGVPLENVTVLPSNTFVTPNNPTSGGSVTSEAICYAVIQACDKLNSLLQPYKDRAPNQSWVDWIRSAVNDNVHLSVSGVYGPNQPGVQGYQIFGVTATEVLVDILTGQHLISRVDLIEDTGQSLSPLVDIGQVEGAFIMGMGYYTSEKIQMNYEGQVLTNNTWTYWPPGPKDIPIDFRIRFPRDNPNPVGVLQSKATAEPPLCMTISVPLAIRNAVASARVDADSTNSRWFPFDGPTSVENVFVNSLNNYSQYVL